MRNTRHRASLANIHTYSWFPEWENAFLPWWVWFLADDHISEVKFETKIEASDCRKPHCIVLRRDMCKLKSPIEWNLLIILLKYLHAIIFRKPFTIIPIEVVLVLPGLSYFNEWWVWVCNRRRSREGVIQMSKQWKQQKMACAVEDRFALASYFLSSYWTELLYNRKNFNFLTEAQFFLLWRKWNLLSVNEVSG